MESVKRNKPRILIVDDMATNIALLSDLLKKQYEIRVAKNGSRAIEIANAKEQPDLILLDIEMPEMDGYEVCRILKNSPVTKNIPIVFVTARNNFKDEAYGLSLGAVDYISKPFHASVVKIRIKNHIDLKLKSDELERLSLLDGLTGIPNRRYFDDFYERVDKASARSGESMAVMMVDIDFFKPYNDNYGHWQGDECLREVASALSSVVKRPGDMVARYGGEEFVVLLKGADEDGVQQIAQALLDAVATCEIVHEFSVVSKFVTVSIGVAFRATKDDTSREELLKRADEKLYEAKEHGRNRFCC